MTCKCEVCFRSWFLFFNRDASSSLVLNFKFLLFFSSVFLLMLLGFTAETFVESPVAIHVGFKVWNIGIERDSSRRRSGRRKGEYINIYVGARR